MWNDMENMEEKWKDLKIHKKIVKRYEKYGKYERKVNFFTKQLILHVIYLSLHYALQKGRNNSVFEGINL